jgi:hypothetical protein
MPAVYAESEGGNWKPWPAHAPAPPIDFYSHRSKCAITYCLTYPHTIIHSLVTPQGWRWDCINGWTGKTVAVVSEVRAD